MRERFARRARPDPAPIDSRPAGRTRRGVIRRVASLAGVDRAVAYGAMSRLFQLASAPITLFMIARFMSPEMQGLYYTFASVTALQAFLELGLYLILTNFASHEWAGLRLDAIGRIVGDPESTSRLVSLGRTVFVLYGVLSVLFVAAVLPFGLWFFSRGVPLQTNWHGPWIALVISTAVLLWTLPFISILEGCGQIAVINRFRVGQVVIGNLSFWIVLGLGGGLWASAALSAVSAVRDLYVLLVQYREFFRPFWARPRGPRIQWGMEVWPMQWRVALTAVSNYLAFSLLTPVMYRYGGPIVAGRTGMTWAVTVATQSLAFMWVYPKVPLAARLVAQREFAQLRRMWLRVSLTSTAIAAVGLGAVWALIEALQWTHHPFSQRLLAPLPAGLFLVGALVGHVIQCLTALLRAHKQEPIVVMNVTSYLLLGALVWSLGRTYGPIGAGAAYLGVLGAVMLPWLVVVTRRSMREWHATPV